MTMQAGVRLCSRSMMRRHPRVEGDVQQAGILGKLGVGGSAIANEQCISGDNGEHHACECRSFEIWQHLIQRLAVAHDQNRRIVVARLSRFG